MSTKYVPEAFEEIDTFFSEGEIEAPCSPVSCAALLAEKLGLPEAQVVMAAGLAGGIGLSGGGCGALGAAIWIGGLRGEEQIMDFGYAGTWIEELIEVFSKTTDQKFECAGIIGRKFENIEDHAEYLRQGGCAEIIEALASFFDGRR
jgi:hypothetical protein